EDPLELALRSIGNDPAAPTRPSTVALKSPPPPPPSRGPGLRRVKLAVLAVLVLGLVSLLVRGWGVTPLPGPNPSPSSPAGSVPTPAPSAPTVIGELTAGLRAIGGEPGHLAIDFEHPLKSGRLRVWVDEEMVLEEKLAARVSKKALMFNYSKGNLAQTLDVSPGHHTIRPPLTS